MGAVGISYPFIADGAVSSLQHTLEYQFDWLGDGTTLVSEWGAAIQQVIWNVAATYFVRVRARCTLHPSIVSFWSPALAVRILDPPPVIDQ
jgi:hypothetical protein